MTYLLDTNVCVQYLRGRSPAVLHRLKSTPVSEVRLCSIVKAELYLGVLRSSNSVARTFGMVLLGCGLLFPALLVFGALFAVRSSVVESRPATATIETFQSSDGHQIIVAESPSPQPSGRPGWHEHAA